jgi:hypothetical protein
MHHFSVFPLMIINAGWRYKVYHNLKEDILGVGREAGYKPAKRDQGLQIPDHHSYDHHAIGPSYYHTIKPSNPTSRSA